MYWGGAYKRGLTSGVWRLGIAPRVTARLSSSEANSSLFWIRKRLERKRRENKERCHLCKASESKAEQWSGRRSVAGKMRLRLRGDLVDGGRWVSGGEGAISCSWEAVRGLCCLFCPICFGEIHCLSWEKHQKRWTIAFWIDYNLRHNARVSHAWIRVFLWIIPWKF